MHTLYPGELNEAYELFYKGFYDEALQKIEDIEKRYKEDSKEYVSSQILKIVFKNYQGEYEEALKLAEKLQEESQIEDFPLLKLDLIIAVITTLVYLGKIDEGGNRIQEGEKILEKSKNKEDFYIKSRTAYLLTQKGQLKKYMGDFKQTLDYFRKSLEIWKEIQNKSEIVNMKNLISSIYIKLGEFDFASKYLTENLLYLKTINNIPRLASTLKNFGTCYLRTGNLDLALEYYLQSLFIYKGLRNYHEIADLCNNIGIVYKQKGLLDIALNIFDTCLYLYQEKGNKQKIAYSHNNIGTVYQRKGELSKALEYYLQSLDLKKEFGNNQDIALTTTNIGQIYQFMGDQTKALEYYEQSLTIKNEIGNSLEIIFSLFYLTHISIDMNLLEKARMYLREMQKIEIQAQNKIITQRTDIARTALLLKSNIEEDIIFAEKLLTDIVEGKIIDHNLTILASLNLCYLLIDKLSAEEEHQKYEGIENLVHKIVQNAKDQQSHMLLAEAYWLQSRFALVNEDIKEAQHLLTQAQQISEKWGYKGLAMRISSDHDKLLDQFDKWQGAYNQKISISERVDLAQIEDLVIKLIQRVNIEVPDLDEEIPIQLIILKETGVPMVSVNFYAKKQFKSELLKKLIETINSFLFGRFSEIEDIERIKYEDYTIIIRKIGSMFFCYVFKGHSYYSLMKLGRFIEKITITSPVWNTLNNVIDNPRKMSKSIKTMIEGLAKEIFFSISS